MGERFCELDVPLLVEWPNGNREAILFVIEEETQGNRFSIHRLAYYCLDMAELMDTERVIPVVIFLNSGTRYLNEEGEIMGLAQLLRQEGRQQGQQEGRREECISLVTRLLRRKFGIHPELGPSLEQLPALPVEKLEDLTEAIFDWAEVSDLTEWLRQQLLESNRTR